MKIQKLAALVACCSSSAVAAEIEAVDVPVFAPLAEELAAALLFEQFAGDVSRWKESHAKKAGSEEFSYVGKWEIEEPSVLPGFAGDKGLVVKSEASHHAITAKLDEPLDNTDNTLVVQYEVKLQNGLECGGAYLKLLSENDELHSEEFNNDSPYQVMFGPDKCGATNKVHFIVRRKSPITGEYEEKHLASPPPARLNKLTNLYTLIIKPTQEYEIRINGDVVKAGSLLAEGEFKPAFNPPTEIPDPDAVKPDDWVDERTIPDPEQSTKPDDWDEDAPAKIPDPEADIPEEWDEDIEPFIPDPEAEEPEDWDDEEDGEWVAPMIENPECEEGMCGKWEAPTVPNPAFKGKWKQPFIPNPDYIGEWEPPLIANPDYYEDKPADLEPIGAIGFELWTMQADILFDNLYIGHSIADAELIGNATYVPKIALEKAVEEALAPPPTEKLAPEFDTPWEQLKSDPINYVKAAVVKYFYEFNEDPAETTKRQPLVFIAIMLAFITLLLVFFGVVLFLLFFLQMLIFPKQKEDKAAGAAVAEKKAVAIENDKTKIVADDSAAAVAASGVEEKGDAKKRA